MKLIFWASLRTYVIGRIRLFLATKGKILCDKKLIESYEMYIKNIVETIDTSCGNIDSIVFSKDRAMQLHAFLKSYVENVDNKGVMYVLYKTTNARHKKSYYELEDLFSDKDVCFIEENEFRRQLIKIVEESQAEKIFYYVDDMIFTHKVDYAQARKINTSRYVLTLSRGMDLSYSVVLKKNLSIPKFNSVEHGYKCFCWDYSAEYSDWTYPLGVSGYMFGRKETLAMLKSIDFKAPNSLEISMQFLKPLFDKRYGLCPEQASCVCVHANIVQTEGHNPVLATFSINELLELWEDGKMINLKEFQGKSVDVAQMQKYSFVARK